MTIIDDFISLFFPRSCFCCAGLMVKGEDILCTDCILKLPKITGYHAHRNAVEDRLMGRLPLVYGFAFFKFKKGNSIQRLLHQLKYENHPEIGIKLGKLCGKELQKKELSTKTDLIIPVPIHLSRMRKRGYNQSVKFAEGLSSELGVPWNESVLIRKKPTPTQTDKSLLSRWHNVSDAFCILDASAIAGKRILLVDDMITTGATLEACGSSLLQARCAELSIVCIAEA